MFKRKVKTHWPVVHFSTEGEESIVQTKQAHTAYATHKQEPAPIEPETECWFWKNPDSTSKQGKVLSTQSNRKYTLQTSDGAQYQCIRVRPSPKPPSKDPTTGELSTPHPNPETLPESPCGKPISSQTTGNPIPYVHSVRERKPPVPYQNYILKWFVFMIVLPLILMICFGVLWLPSQHF